MDERDRIDILLATFDGAKYLPEQLASIEAQTHGDWRLIARDDGSSDGTPAILEAFRARHPERVALLHDADGNLGLVANFSRLMEASTAPYAALCDQDDVWQPDKLALTLARMRALESEHGPETPLLVFTDLEVVDEELNRIHESFWDYVDLAPASDSDLSSLLVRNVVTGCTTLMNRPLRLRAAPIPPEARVHDWWLAVVAAALGTAAHIGAPTVRYRQHGGNQVGATGWSARVLVQKVWDHIADYPTRKKALVQRFAQASALLRLEGLTPQSRHCRTLQEFVTIPEMNIGRRFRQCWKINALRRRPLVLVAVVLFSKGPRDKSSPNSATSKPIHTSDDHSKHRQKMPSSLLKSRQASSAKN